MKTTTIEKVMDCVIESADVIDGMYLEPYGRFFSIDKCAVLHDTYSMALAWSYPIFVSDRGDLLVGVDYKDWNTDVLYGLFCPGDNENPDMYRKADPEKYTKKFYNYSKLVLGLSYNGEDDPYADWRSEEADRKLFNDLLKYLIDRSVYVPAQFKKELGLK